jgi:hypothetical protein
MWVYRVFCSLYSAVGYLLLKIVKDCEIIKCAAFSFFDFFPQKTPCRLLGKKSFANLSTEGVAKKQKRSFSFVP